MTRKAKQLLLKDLLIAYINARNVERPINKPLADKTHAGYQEVVHVFSKFLGRPATTADLNAECVNKFLRHEFVNGKTEYSVKNRRTGLRLLWNFAHKIGLAEPFAGVQAVQVSPLNIQGFSLEQITKLVEHTSTLRGVIRKTGLPKRIWWETFLTVNWETAVRIGDMFSIAPQDWDKSGWLWIAESKTGKRGWRRIRDSAAKLLTEFIEFDSEREKVWPGFKRRHLYRAFSKLCDQAGLEGSARWIRRGAASEVEKAHPGAAWKYLRHSVPDLFDKHYRVDKIVEEKPLLPPVINAKVFRPKPQK